MAELEDEVLIEVEAVQSVYGDDCLVIDRFPPHLHIHVKPRTADVSSQQFVEATIGIKAGPQYPDEPPHVDLVECKGLDELRQKHILASIRDKAKQLSSCLMLVALCEEAVEMLTAMNHPDGDCPLCLYPLVPEDEEKILPFMKLMSCFHCFHSECIIRWWKWLQEGEKNDNQDHPKAPEESAGNCPVCRKTFHIKDLEHVLSLVGLHRLESNGNEVGKDDEVLHSDYENTRKQKFEAILKSQEERNGLIEPRKDLVVQPGMFLAPSVPLSTASSMTEPTEQEPLRTNSSGRGKYQKGKAVTRNSTGPSNTRSHGEHRNRGIRNDKSRSTVRQVRQWVKKDEGTAG